MTPRPRPTARAAAAYLGLDLGGTNIKYGVVDANGTMIWDTRVATPTERPLPVPAIIDITVEAFEQACQSGHLISGVGVAAPGRVDSVSGHVLAASNLHWQDVPLGLSLEQKLGVPVRVLNDANAAAIGELAAGDPTSRDFDLIYISIGTGVGAGMIIGGHLYTGETLNAGELGHVVAVPDGRQCPCGGIGCLETVASGPGIIQTYRATLQRTGRSDAGMSMTLPDVVTAAAAGDQDAIDALSCATASLGIQVANFRNLLDVSHFVIGGGVANIGWPLVPQISQAAARYLAPGKRGRLEVRKSTMIDRAAIIGAVSYLRTHASALPTD